MFFQREKWFRGRWILAKLHLGLGWLFGRYYILFLCETSSLGLTFFEQIQHEQYLLAQRVRAAATVARNLQDLDMQRASLGELRDTPTG